MPAFRIFVASLPSPRMLTPATSMVSGLETLYVPAGKYTMPPPRAPTRSITAWIVGRSSVAPSPAPNHLTLKGPENTRRQRPAAPPLVGWMTVPASSGLVSVLLQKNTPPPPSPATKQPSSTIAFDVVPVGAASARRFARVSTQLNVVPVRSALVVSTTGRAGSLPSSTHEVSATRPSAEKKPAAALLREISSSLGAATSGRRGLDGRCVGSVMACCPSIERGHAMRERGAK